MQSYEDETPQVDKTEYANSMRAMFEQPPDNSDVFKKTKEKSKSRSPQKTPNKQPQKSQSNSKVKKSKSNKKESPAKNIKTQQVKEYVPVKD